MGKRKSSIPKKHNDNSFVPLAFNYIPVVKKRKSSRLPKQIKEYSNVLPNEGNERYLLGKLPIGSTNNSLVDYDKSCKISFNHDTKSIILNYDSEQIVVCSPMFLQLTKDILSTKMFALKFMENDGELFMEIYAIALPFPKFLKPLRICVQRIFKHFFNIQNDMEENAKKKSDNTDLKKIFNYLKENRKNPLPNLSVQHPQLVPTLRPYQEDAVRWMISQEKTILDEEMLDPLYTEVKLQSGLTVYYDKHSGYVDTQKPLVLKSNRGGILAEEMGLGKTVEVLACILLNRQPHNTDTQKENFSETGSPIIHKQTKNKSVDITDDALTLTDQTIVPKSEAKRSKIPMKFIKSRNNKSSSRIALESLYDRLVLNKFEPVKVEDPKLQCICSLQSERGSIKCTRCDKRQHVACVGYKKSFGPYLCPQCWMEEPLFDVGATLIVTPNSLQKQWCREISKHVRHKFNILQYEGSDSRGTMYPTKLKEYDVVITTYNVLQNDLRLTENEKPMEFRRKRKYSPPGCPLTRVNWWRLCLDEAQMVESPRTMISAMTRKLSANFRWAVTGTPIAKDISDIYGLLEYLLVTPYNNPETWSNILYKPLLKGDHIPISQFLSSIMWRTEKNDVLDQINLPQLTKLESFLEFSAVEKFFYKKEHEMCRYTFFSACKKYDPTTTLDSMERSNINKIMAPFLSIRQACTHPHTSKGKYLPTKKNITSLKGLLEALITKNTTESEEMLRAVVSSLNGLAGINILYKNTTQAIEYYRQVLQLAARFKQETQGTLQVDTLQTIHTIHNLSELLLVTTDVQPTLHDETLGEDCKKLEEKYIERFMNESLSAYNEWKKVYDKIEETFKNFKLTDGQWYTDGINYLNMRGFYQELLDKCTAITSRYNVELKSKFNETDIMYLISSWDKTICDLRANLIEAMEDLYNIMPLENNDKTIIKIIIGNDVVSKATNCHLRNPKKSKKKTCPICVANSFFVEYEVKLFNAETRFQEADLKTVKGAWIPSVEECVMRGLAQVLRSKKVDQSIVDDSSTNIELIQFLKDEFELIRKYWTHLYQQVNAQDELEMCKIRMELKQTDADDDKKKGKKRSILKILQPDTPDKLFNINLIDASELNQQEYLLKMEERNSMIKLEKNLGIKKYLETLKKQQYDGENPDPCPICKNTLENSWSILTCGHAYCLECLQLHIQQARHIIQCALCRNKQNIADISYISKHADAEADDNSVKGNYSTKIESVVKLVLQLKQENVNVKVLIFSSWVDILKHVAQALDTNNVKNVLVSQNAKMEVIIEKFKDDSQQCTALLLPIKLGSKGLNLIEATHVILIEPVLNPADELQAIGRVHRIGQTKKTYFHKFIIKNTIESSIHEAISSNSKEWSKDKICIRQLVDLFSCEDVVEGETMDCDGAEKSVIVGEAMNDGNNQDNCRFDDGTSVAGCSSQDSSGSLNTVGQETCQLVQSLTNNGSADDCRLDDGVSVAGCTSQDSSGSLNNVVQEASKSVPGLTMIGSTEDCDMDCRLDEGVSVAGCISQNASGSSNTVVQETCQSMQSLTNNQSSEDSNMDCKFNDGVSVAGCSSQESSGSFKNIVQETCKSVPGLINKGNTEDINMDCKFDESVQALTTNGTTEDNNMYCDAVSSGTISNSKDLQDKSSSNLVNTLNYVVN